MIRVAYEEVKSEAQRIDKRLGNNPRRPVEEVIQRVARTRLEKQVIERRRQNLESVVVGTNIGAAMVKAGLMAPSHSEQLSQEFEKAMVERLVNSKRKLQYQLSLQRLIKDCAGEDSDFCMTVRLVR